MVQRKHQNVVDSSILVEQFPCRISESLIQPYVNVAFSRVVAGPSEGRAKLAKINEITTVDSGVEVIHLASQT